MNSPAGIRTSFMPMEFVIASGSAWSADANLGSSFGADKATAALTTISISVQHRAFLCIMISSKKRMSGPVQTRNK
jgi:hypothetical protein